MGHCELVVVHTELPIHARTHTHAKSQPQRPASSRMTRYYGETFTLSTYKSAFIGYDSRLYGSSGSPEPYSVTASWIVSKPCSCSEPVGTIGVVYIYIYIGGRHKHPRADTGTPPRLSGLICISRDTACTDGNIHFG